MAHGVPGSFHPHLLSCSTALGAGEECDRNKLQCIPILLPSVNVGLEMLEFGLSLDVHINGMCNWQTKRFSFMYISSGMMPREGMHLGFSFSTDRVCLITS